MNTDWLFNRPIAHRGLHTDGAAENSMTAFSKAIEAGYNIEIDVRLNKDGDVVILHDGTLKRVAGVDKKISDCTTAELKNYPLEGTANTVPLLTDLLAAAEGKTGILIELKNYMGTTKLPKVLCKILQNYKGEYAVQCFNPYTVRWFYKHAPEVQRGYLRKSLLTKNLPRFMRRAIYYCGYLRFTKPNFIAYEIKSLDSYHVRYAHSKNINVLVWTVKSPALLKKAHAMADNIIFEDIVP